MQRRLSIWRRMAARNKYFWPALILTSVVLLLDQLTKQLVLAHEQLGGRPLCSPLNEKFCGQIDVSAIFDLTFKWNKGVSFGMGSEWGLVSRIGFSIISIAVACGLLIWLTNLRRRVAAFGVGMIIGGAIGNAIDRIAYGAVVDFLDFSGLYLFNTNIHFPFIFNVADVAINIGVACLIYDAFVATPEKTK